jgi:hypothetical protein
MKQKIGIAVGVVLVAGIAGFAQSGGSASDEVLRAVRMAGDAQVKGDKATFERLTSDDYMYIHSSGSVANKSDDVTALTAPDMKWTSISYADLKARVYDNAAIVTGTETLAGAAKGYVPGPRRLTDVWVKRNGTWQTAAGISTVVSKEPSDRAATSMVKNLKPKTIAGATADERAVLQQDAAYAKTELDTDDVRARALRAKDFSFVSRLGSVAAPNEPQAAPQAKTVVVAYDRVRTYGTLAVVHGSLLWTDVKGFSPGVLRFVRVWVNEGNGWKVAAEQRTPAVAARPAT